MVKKKKKLHCIESLIIFNLADTILPPLIINDITFVSEHVGQHAVGVLVDQCTPGKEETRYRCCKIETHHSL